ncbi:hypothetical protein HGA91_01570 [candidate division WWE3 bacterium]|nr:hypothetical protein [candidate division WWE3 bacterium]
MKSVKSSVEMDDAETLKVELHLDPNESSENRPTLGMMIGSRGETLLALEYILALMVNRGREQWIRVYLDMDGYRRRRQDELKDMAIKAADKVRFLHEPVTLVPMSSHDRRIVHTALSAIDGVVTESVGEGRDRKVIVKPA